MTVSFISETGQADSYLLILAAPAIRDIAYLSKKETKVWKGLVSFEQ